MNFVKNFKNTLFYRTPPVAASVKEYSETSQTSKLKLLARIVNSFQVLSFFPA